METIPGIRDSVPGALWNATGEVERRHRGKSLTLAELVEKGEVHSPTEGTVMLPSDHHTVASCH